MKERITPTEFYRLQPRVPKALMALHEAAAESIEPGLIHLIFYRVSQLNGCAFCQHMHAAEARRDGERQERLDMLSGWREAPGFSDRERLGLAWAEVLTLLAQSGVPDTLHDEVHAAFGTKGLADLTTVVLVINSWNRIAVSNRFVPQLAEAMA